MTTLLLIALIGFLMYAFPFIPFVLLHFVKMALYMCKDMFTYIKVENGRNTQTMGYIYMVVYMVAVSRYQFLNIVQKYIESMTM